RARIARLAEEARMEDQRVQRLDEERRALDQIIASPTYASPRAQSSPQREEHTPTRTRTDRPHTPEGEHHDEDEVDLEQTPATVHHYRINDSDYDDADSD